MERHRNTGLKVRIPIALCVLLSTLYFFRMEVLPVVGVTPSVIRNVSLSLNKMKPRKAVFGKSSGKPLPFPCHAFWHLGDTGLPAFSIVAHDQYQRLRRSGLLDIASVTASYIGAEASGMPRFNDSRITLEFVGPSTLYEYPTLRKLQMYCALTPEARVLYFHTKGTTTRWGSKQRYPAA